MRTLSSLSMIALLAGCSPEPPEACMPDDAPWADFDQDGYPAEIDCNDSDPAIHPAAFEECDGIDNNCDGVIDEGYPDITGDGVADCDPVEVCDGADNNANTLIDEGFPDFDGDDVADCLDDACELFVDAVSREIPIDEECTEPVIEVVDPWDVVIEAQWRDGSDTSGSYAMPAIGRFIDTNGDGVVDLGDVPVIVITTQRSNLVAVRGDTLEKVFDEPGFRPYVGVALVDVNADGETNVVSIDTGGRVVALDRRGDVLWRSTETEANVYSPPVVADVDSDGVPEVITNTMLLDGADGSLRTRFGAPSGIPYYVPTVGDIDLDGEQEILIGRNVYSPDGTIEWSHSIVGNYGHWGAFVNIDDDSEAEVVVVGGGRVGFYEHDGTVIREISTAAASRPGPICVADFDGDGVVELAWASQSVLSVYNLDATSLWSGVIRDFSGLAGCSGYDVNGDGAYEVLFADENAFRIFDGRTGEVRYEQGGHRSGTIFEYPTIADVDGDGSAEVVITSNFHTSTWGTITVFGHDGDGWPPSGETWPVHDFAVTNVLPDGSIPSPPEPPWLVHNVYRARPSADTVSANLLVEITDACVSGCAEGVGVVSLAVEVSNTGASDVRTDVPVTVYAVEGADLVPLDTQFLSGGVAGGTRTGGLSFSFPIEQLTSDGFVVRVDDTGAGNGVIAECSEEDNETTWPYPVCE